MPLPIYAVTKPTPLAGQPNGNLSLSLLTTFTPPAGGSQIRLLHVAARSGQALIAAAGKAGIRLKATSYNDSYRTYAVQESTFLQRYTLEFISGRPRKYWRNSWWYLKSGYATAAVPGTSNHGLGLAVDFGEERDGDSGVESISTVAVNWLTANAVKFGWSAELQSEPWHWRHFTGDTVTAAVLAYEQEEENDLGTLDGQQGVWLYNTAMFAEYASRGADEYPARTGDNKPITVDLKPYWARIAAEVAKNPVGTVTVDVDEAAIAKAVNDDAAARLAD